MALAVDSAEASKAAALDHHQVADSNHQVSIQFYPNIIANKKIIGHLRSHISLPFFHFQLFQSKCTATSYGVPDRTSPGLGEENCEGGK